MAETYLITVICLDMTDYNTLDKSFIVIHLLFTSLDLEIILYYF